MRHHLAGNSVLDQTPSLPSVIDPLVSETRMVVPRLPQNFVKSTRTNCLLSPHGPFHISMCTWSSHA